MEGAEEALHLLVVLVDMSNAFSRSSAAENVSQRVSSVCECRRSRLVGSE